MNAKPILEGENPMDADSPLEQPAPAILAAAVEENIFAMYRRLAEALHGEIEETPGLGRFHAFPLSPMFKAAYRARLEEGEADAAIEETMAWFKARQAPFFFWWAGADSRPADLERRLLAHGFSVFEKDAPAMFAEIDRLNWDIPRPAELSIEPAASDADLLSWKDTFVQSFAVPEFAGQAWVDATREAGLDQAPYRLLVGRINREPAGCAMLTCGAGVAGILGLGTVSQFRRRGIGSALLLDCLRIARQMGYRYTVLFATPMGYSSYLKLGYQDTGRTVTRYLWRAS
jgi:ribosomal protein S18 acetylase RimI-like enzyme